MDMAGQTPATAFGILLLKWKICYYKTKGQFSPIPFNWTVYTKSQNEAITYETGLYWGYFYGSFKNGIASRCSRIVVTKTANVQDQLNNILSRYGEIIVVRMGIVSERGISVIA